MTKREKVTLRAMRIIAVILIVFGLLLEFFTVYGIVFIGLGAVLFVLIFGLKCNYEDAAEERALLKKEREKQKENLQKETDLT